MAEGGFIERLFGGGEDGESDAEGVSAAVDPVAATVAVEAARFDPELSRKAGEYLDEHKHLVRIQTEHLHEQRAVQLDHLKLRRMGERMRVAIQAFFVAVGALIAFGFAIMVWDAATDHGLVVEAFSVPPDLAARGLTGQVVAKQVMDQLAELQVQSKTLRAADTYANNWGDDLKVEIPETGMSVGDVRRWLRDTLGHETHITGEVYRGPDGLTITTRAGDDGAKRLTGSDADFNKLIEQAAEQLFHVTQPYRYAIYLDDRGRRSEAETVFRDIIAHGDLHERAWAHIGLGLASMRTDDFSAAAAQSRLALQAVPHFAPALTYLSVAEWTLEHESSAVQAGQEFLRARSSMGHDIAKVDRQGLVLTQDALASFFLGDEQKAVEAGTTLARSASVINQEGWLWVSGAQLADHNLVGAREAADHLTSEDDREELLMPISVDAREPSALALAQKVYAVRATGSHADYARRNIAPWLALALAQAGDLKSALATIADTPIDCDLCLRTRGTLASFAGNQKDVESWFAKAVARTLDLPWAYVARGQARFRAGNLDGALADAQKAVRVSPRLADGYGLWGDVLARRQRWGAAKAKYDEALRYAPAWAAAHRARDEVAARN